MKEKRLSNGQKELNVMPRQTKDGLLYAGWDLIQAIRQENLKVVLKIRELIFPNENICAATVDLLINNEVLASAGAAASWGDPMDDGQTIGSGYVSSAVTKAKKYAIMDYFGLKDEYIDTDKADDNAIMAGIIEKLHEQSDKGQTTKGSVS